MPQSNSNESSTSWALRACAIASRCLARIASTTLTTRPEAASLAPLVRHCRPSQGPKACIARNTSQLNYVPDTRCHVAGRLRGAGMRVATLLQQKGRHTPRPGRKQASGYKTRLRILEAALLPRTSFIRNSITTITTTLLHKSSKRPTPSHNRGFFLRFVARGFALGGEIKQGSRRRAALRCASHLAQVPAGNPARRADPLESLTALGVPAVQAGHAAIHHHDGRGAALARTAARLPGSATSRTRRSAWCAPRTRRASRPRASAGAHRAAGLRSRPMVCRCLSMT